MNSEQQGKLEAAQSGSQLSPFPAALSRIGALAQSTRAEGAPLGWHSPALLRNGALCWQQPPAVGSPGRGLGAVFWGASSSPGSWQCRFCPSAELSLLCRLGGEFVSDLFCAVIGSDRWSAKRRKAEWSSLQMAGRKWVRFLECY